MGTLTVGGVCGGSSNLAGKLEGAGVCSSGYRRSSGWKFPVAHLINEGIMPVGLGQAGLCLRDAINCRITLVLVVWRALLHS